MPLIDSNHGRAALLVLLLGIALVIALTPYATGLLGIPVLYAVFAPVHDWLGMRVRPRVAAGLVVALALFLIVVPGVSFAGLIVNQAQEIAGGVIRNPLLGRLRELRLGGIDLGPRLADLGATVVGWVGSSAFGLVGTATRLALNLTISLFGLFYLLLKPDETWKAVQPYIPFSAKNTEKLRQRFRDVTTATIVGTGLTAAIQGSLVGLGFWLTGLPNAVFWGVVTMVFAILPVVGSGLVWGPGALALMLGNHALAGILLALGGIVIVGNVDYVIRPRVFSRWANIHPLVTLIGALAGVPYFGILGLLIGPLALSYFFELIKMYGEEYLG
jgi:predicted PurR-regulated permease PerM